jgi:hypothetical protein
LRKRNVHPGDKGVNRAVGWLLFATTLVTGFTQKLAVIFLRHPLTTLLDY